MFSCEFCKTFKNTFSDRTPAVAASVSLMLGDVWNISFNCLKSNRHWKVFYLVIKGKNIEEKIKLRSNHQRCSIKTGALKNFAKLTGKHLSQTLFRNNLKREPSTGVFMRILQKFQKHIFCITHPIDCFWKVCFQTYKVLWKCDDILEDCLFGYITETKLMLWTT